MECFAKDEVTGLVLLGSLGRLVSVLVDLKLWRYGDVAIVAGSTQKDYKTPTIAERKGISGAHKVAVRGQLLSRRHSGPNQARLMKPITSTVVGRMRNNSVPSLRFWIPALQSNRRNERRMPGVVGRFTLVYEKGGIALVYEDNVIKLRYPKRLLRSGNTLHSDFHGKLRLSLCVKCRLQRDDERHDFVADSKPRLHRSHKS